MNIKMALWCFQVDFHGQRMLNTPKTLIGYGVLFCLLSSKRQNSLTLHQNDVSATQNTTLTPAQFIRGFQRPPSGILTQDNSCPFLTPLFTLMFESKGTLGNGSFH
jgi:hypothetical protein